MRVMATSWRERRWNWTEIRGVGTKALDPRAELTARDFCMASECVSRDQRVGEESNRGGEVQLRAFAGQFGTSTGLGAKLDSEERLGLQRSAWKHTLDTT